MDPRVSIIGKRLSQVRRILVVASGKGGVGKSVVASGLALHLAEQKHRVGLLDLDVYGPSSHMILGLKNKFPREEKGLIPPRVHGVSFMSIVFFSQDKPAPFRGDDITNVILELLAVTQWDALDYLIIDLPPGLGEETLDLLRFIKRGEFLVVTTPSKVSWGAVEKLVTLLQELHVPVVGVLENMKRTPSSFIKEEVRRRKIPYLGCIRFDDHFEETLGDKKRFLGSQFMRDLGVCLSRSSFLRGK